MPICYFTECDICESRVDRKMTNADGFPVLGWCLLSTATEGHDGAERCNDDSDPKYGICGHAMICPVCSDKLLDFLQTLDSKEK